MTDVSFMVLFDLLDRPSGVACSSCGWEQRVPVGHTSSWDWLAVEMERHVEYVHSLAEGPGGRGRGGPIASALTEPLRAARGSVSRASKTAKRTLDTEGPSVGSTRPRPTHRAG